MMTTSRSDRLVLSAGRVRRYGRCPASYAFRYGEKEAPKEAENHHMRGGKVLHAAIEMAAHARLDFSSNHGKHMFVERHELVERLGEACARAGMPQDEKAAVLTKIQCVSSVDLSGMIMQPELGFGFHSSCAHEPIDIGGALLGGVWDLVKGTIKDGRVHRVEIIDWKFGEDTPLTHYEARLDPQIGQYLVMARDFFPHAVEINVTLNYLLQERSVTVEWSKDLDRFHRGFIRSIYHRISNDETWKGRVSADCATCSFASACETFHSAMEHGIIMSQGEMPDLKNMSDEHLLGERYETSAAAKILDARRKAIDHELKGRMAGKKRLHTDSYVGTMTGRNLKSMDHGSLERLAKEIGVGAWELARACTTINVNKCQAALREAEWAVELEDYVDYRVSRSLRVKEV